VSWVRHWLLVHPIYATDRYLCHLAGSRGHLITPVMNVYALHNVTSTRYRILESVSKRQSDWASRPILLHGLIRRTSRSTLATQLGSHTQFTHRWLTDELRFSRLGLIYALYSGTCRIPCNATTWCYTMTFGNDGQPEGWRWSRWVEAYTQQLTCRPSR